MPSTMLPWKLLPALALPSAHGIVVAAAVEQEGGDASPSSSSVEMLARPLNGPLYDVQLAHHDGRQAGPLDDGGGRE